MNEKVREPVFDISLTKAICDILAQTDYPGLSSSEIDTLLAMSRIRQREHGANKRDSLFRTLHNTQVRQKCGNALIVFVRTAMDNTRYAADPKRREMLADELGPILALHGLKLDKSGRLAYGRRAQTLSEAAELTGSLRAELLRREVHPELLRYCSEELVSQSLFHAMSEAAKSVPDRIRQITGSNLDGADLYDAVLGTKNSLPILRIGGITTESAASEQRGFKNLLLGIHGHYRNPRAHKTRLGATESKQDLLDAYSLLSYVHRLLDGATIQS